VIPGLSPKSRKAALARIPLLADSVGWPKPWNVPSALADERLSVMEDETVLDASCRTR
jgi:predicted metalloendopeptidase